MTNDAIAYLCFIGFIVVVRYAYRLANRAWNPPESWD